MKKYLKTLIFSLRSSKRSWRLRESTWSCPSCARSGRRPATAAWAATTRPSRITRSTSSATTSPTMRTRSAPPAQLAAALHRRSAQPAAVTASLHRQWRHITHFFFPNSISGNRIIHSVRRCSATAEVVAWQPRTC